MLSFKETTLVDAKVTGDGINLEFVFSDRLP